MVNRKIFLILLLLLSFEQVFSQVKVPKKDSTEVYKNIAAYSKKHKFTNLMHKWIFRPINPKKNKKRVIPISYQKIEGKIIREINIITLDPFGYSEIDTTKKANNWAEKNGNSIHIKTKKIAIRNLLLFRKNKPLDSLLVKESLRLIRSQRYISRVAITTNLVAKNSDSVDVTIRVLDSWSLLPRLAVSNSKFAFQFNERNFFGSGHTFNTRIQKRYEDGKNAYRLEYIVPNINNTFIETKLNYFKNLDDNYVKELSINRPFYSPFAKWAGGINWNQQFRADSLQDVNLVYAKQNFKYNTQDYWLGRAFKISSGNDENERVTNLIFSGRFLNVKYVETPTIAYDSDRFYSSEHFFLSGIGISTRKYVEDKYIFRNGIIEDVPIGKIFGFTGGYQYKNQNGRFYLGSQMSFGNYFKFGFLSLNFELGTFFNHSVTEQTAFTFQANYFTNLIDLGKWKLRQFVKPQLTIGINRLNYVGDQLSINEEYGISGFNSAVYGDQKAMLTFQTQTYSPWKLLGFRLNPYANLTLAMLANKEIRLIKSPIFSKIGLGVIINNDFLVFQTFQISIAYYPSIPGNGSNVLKTNTFETSDFGFQDFGLDKPRTVIYK